MVVIDYMEPKMVYWCRFMAIVYHLKAICDHINRYVVDVGHT